ncbi:MAG: hypothetical protein LBK73_07050 [Treponema sp.]|jgi:hypothetical protein|nr:hypothetical protein [Treponema sp.]
MRIQQFFEAIEDYNFSRAAELAVSEKIVGGWEAWFQVELAMHLVEKFQGNVSISREMSYPDKSARCDFYIEYGGGRDPTYVELKCQLPGRGDAINNALFRFEADITKQKGYPEIAGFCFMASCGPWNDVNIATFETIFQTVDVASAYVLGWSNGEYEVAQLKGTGDLAYFQNPYFFLTGISAWPDEPDDSNSN